MVRLDMGNCCELKGYHGEPSQQGDTAQYWHGDACGARTELRTAPRVTATKRASVPQLARVVQRAWHNGPPPRSWWRYSAGMGEALQLELQTKVREDFTITKKASSWLKAPASAFTIKTPCKTAGTYLAG